MGSASESPLNHVKLAEAHQQAIASGRFVDWLGYVLYRRQLGYPLSRCRYNEADRWLSLGVFERLTQRIVGHRYRQLGNLMDEYHYITARLLTEKPKVKPVDREFVRSLRDRRDICLTDIHQQITDKKIAIVGNSPNLINKGLGAEIDKHDFVIRFNQCFSKHSVSNDIGTKLSLWVIAPDFRGDYQTPEFATMIAGPAMLWKLQHWDFIRECKLPVTDLPLSTWRAAVSQVNAPPSAGLLTLTWLKQQGLLKNCTMFGFGFAGSGQYHQALPKHQPSQRHDWDKERQIIEKWQLKS